MILNTKKILKKILIIILIIIYILSSKNFLSFNIKQNIIPIAFSINNKFTLPLIVTLTSILYNSNNNTFYYFHIMVSNAFSEINKNKIIGLNKKFYNFKIIFLDIKDKYKGWYTGGYYDIATYYRLSLSDLVINFDKIIYLDVDNLIHTDLTELYNIDMKNYYYMGTPNKEIGKMEIKGTRNFIGAGVMLVNLEKLRKVNASRLFEDYYYKYGTKKVDEYLINVVFYKNIGFLPYIYGLPDFDNNNNPESFFKSFNGYLNITFTQLLEAVKNTRITHNNYTLKKWWDKKYEELTNIGKKWIFYALKSNVFFEICQVYNQYNKKCQQLIEEEKHNNNIYVN